MFADEKLVDDRKLTHLLTYDIYVDGNYNRNLCSLLHRLLHRLHNLRGAT